MVAMELTNSLVLSAEIATLVAAEVAPSVHLINSETPSPSKAAAVSLSDAEYAKLPLRSPVVTIMGHVDHGKTTLLDTLRNSSIVAGEAGGITQHIGAFSVSLPSGSQVTFLDTPGHSAFESMRARGANVTDIVILVVAADDGVMPQTREAIKHARAADVPMIIAINKCDKPNAKPEDVYNQLLVEEIQVEALGGDTPCVHISAKTGDGLNDLEETILALAEVLDLRADPQGTVRGVVLEAHVATGLGMVATILVHDGTLRVGETIVAGSAWGKVRYLTNEKGEKLPSLNPGSAARIGGWKSLPKVGDSVTLVSSEEEAKSEVQTNLRRLSRLENLTIIDQVNAAKLVPKEKSTSKSKFVKTEAPTVETKDALIPISVIIKGDVSGSVEAVQDAIEAISHSKLHIRVIDTGVGSVMESDIDRAKAAMKAESNTSDSSYCVIVAFGVKEDKKIKGKAKQNEIPMVSSNIIYKLIQDFKTFASTVLPPIEKEDIAGEATVAQIFSLTGRSQDRIAGCKITSGVLQRKLPVRILRQGNLVWEGTLKTMKHFKNDVQEIAKGNECGLAFDGFDDVQEGDTIMAIRMISEPQKLE
jgi:translation initiation factor IF-2